MFRDLGGGTTCYFPLLPGKGFKRHAVVYVEGILWRGKEVPVAICYALTGGEGGGVVHVQPVIHLWGGGGGREFLLQPAIHLQDTHRVGLY